MASKSKLKPLTFWGGVLGPNPGKVAMVLNELDLPFESIYVPFAGVKKAEYTIHNLNGRLPTLEDPNTGIRLRESGAIIQHLIDEYDRDYKISFEFGTPECHLARQWLHFQMSGQGPYYGQAW